MKKESKDMQLSTAIILNRILQTNKSPARKTHKQLAEKFSCDVSKVVRVEHFILDKLKSKIAVLKILLTMDI